MKCVGSDVSDNSNKKESDNKRNLSDCINDFLRQLDDEIKKFYRFYTEIERSIYEDINKHLHYENRFW